MTFREFKLQAHEIVSKSMAKAGYPAILFDVSEPPRKEFGDLTCNVAFLLSKQLKMPPPKIAHELIEKGIKPYLAEKKQNQFPFIKSVEPHPAGYVNFRFDYAVVAKDTLGHALENPDRYGYVGAGMPRRIVIEHTSVNPNKALHVGHMRNVILGDTLYRIMKAANHEVQVLNYVDDSGLQVADIVIGFLFAGFPREPPDGRKFDQYCGDEVYVKVNQLYEQDPALAEKRKLVLREIEEGGGSEIARFAAEITKRVLDEQLKTCWRMKVRYDILNFESQIVHSQMWGEAFDLMKKEGLARFEEEGKNRGCWVIEAQGEEDKVIVRSDGTATYVAKDIPYAAWKLGLVPDPFNYEKYAGQWDGTALYATALSEGGKADDNGFFKGGERVITIIDSRQARLQRIISQVLGKMTGAADTDGSGRHEYQHLGYEAVTLSAGTAKALGIDIGERQFMHMSGRKGVYVGADYVLDHLRGKAQEEVKARNPEFSDEQAGQIAEEVAISAIRYNMIKQDLDKIITFDINESMSLEGDTGPYLQYAYARSQRILEKSGAALAGPVADNYALLKEDAEVELVKEISKMDLVVEDAAKSQSPKALARYAYGLAATFNSFYEKVPVLKAQDAGTLAARLALVKALGIALKNVLSILGITALSKM